MIIRYHCFKSIGKGNYECKACGRQTDQVEEYVNDNCIGKHLPNKKRSIKSWN